MVQFMYINSASLQRLYQYVFGVSNFDESFIISRMLPREVIPCSDSATLESVHLNQPWTLAVTFDEGDIWEQLKEPVVERHVCQTGIDKYSTN